MNSRKFILFATLLFVILQMPFAALRTVSKNGRGQYSTIFGALNDAQDGDEIVILDFETY